MDLAEKEDLANHDAILCRTFQTGHYAMASFLQSEYQYLQQLAKIFPYMHIQPPKQFLRYGLNTRQEIEAAAQQIYAPISPAMSY